MSMAASVDTASRLPMESQAGDKNRETGPLSASSTMSGRRNAASRYQMVSLLFRARARARAKTSLLASAVASAALLTVVAAVGFASPAAASPALESTGSSFAGIAMQQWVGQASTLYGLNINWQVSSSVIGLDNFAQSEIDFAASDIPYSSGQASSTPNFPYEYMPDVAGALAFMFNLTGRDGQRITSLVLDAQVLDEIFTGQITTWNAQPIAELQSPAVQANLPGTTIVPVYRDDASGENYLLSSYLLQMDGSSFRQYQEAMQSAYPGQPTATWPTPVPGQTVPPGYPGWTNGNLVGQQGSDNEANYVAAASSNGAIGYVETAYAIQDQMPVASLINQSGNAVQPTSVNDATALEKAILYSDLTQNLSGVFTNDLPNAYPVSAYSYLVTPCSPALAAAQKPPSHCSGPSGTSTFPADKGQALGQFVAFLACAGQEKMAILGYSPLPPNLVDEDFDAIGRLNGGHQPPPATASNCSNPYVDGQTPLPGEPSIVGGAPPSGQGGSGSSPGGSQTGSTTPGTTTPGGSTTPGSTTPGSGPGGNGPGAGTRTTSSGRSAPTKGKSGTKGSGTSPNSAIAKYLKKVKSGSAEQGASSFVNADGLSAAASSALGLSSPIALVILWCVVFVAVIFVPVFALGRRRRTNRRGPTELSGALAASSTSITSASPRGASPRGPKTKTARRYRRHNSGGVR
jgi:phosphate transport system substrate-binding protein